MILLCSQFNSGVIGRLQRISKAFRQVRTTFCIFLGLISEKGEIGMLSFGIVVYIILFILASYVTGEHVLRRGWIWDRGASEALVTLIFVLCMLCP